MKHRHDRLYKNFCIVGLAIVCCLMLCVFRFIPADAQSQPTGDSAKEQELDNKIQTFFNTLARINAASAFDEVVRPGPLGTPSASAQLNDLRNKVEELKSQFGEIVHWERYGAKQIGEDIIVMRYILKYDQYPVIWTFTFYRKPSLTSSINNPNPWGLVGLHFDVDMENL